MSERALIVTGDPALKGLLVPIFEGVGLEPVVVASVALAAEHAGAGGFALLVLDREQPEGQSAFVFLRRIKSQDPSPPVLMVCGNAAPDDLVAAFRLGAGEVLRKPLRAGMVGAALTRILPSVAP